MLLGACAGPPPLQPGWNEAQVRAQLGNPTGRYTMPDTRIRLEYARGPMGHTTWMIDLGTDGRVQQWQQVLDRPHFARVQAGMSAEAVLQMLGRPSARQPHLAGRSSWFWRFVTYDCEWFAITLDSRGQVLEAGAFPRDPTCDLTDRRD